MEDEIEASPTSQKKRKKTLGFRMSGRIRATNGQQKMLSNSEMTDQSNNILSETTGNSECSIHKSMWRSAYLLEEADKVQCNSKRRLEFRRHNLNENGMPGPAGFFTLSQLCANQPTTEGTETQWDVSESQLQRLDDELKEKCLAEPSSTSSSNIVQVKESQWDVSVSESQFQRLDDEVKEVYSSRATQSNENIRNGSNDLIETTENNSLKRRSSILQAILAEWPSSSPVKMMKAEEGSEPISPRFIFNKKRAKRTYSRERVTTASRRILPKFATKTSLAHNEMATTAFDEVVNVGVESCQQPADLMHHNEDDVEDEEEEDFNESLNIVDNIQSLSKFFSQPTNEQNVTSDDEEDFLGFDGVAEFNGGLVSQTVLQHEYESNRDVVAGKATNRTTEENLFNEDDDIFANIQTQLDEATDEKLVASTKEGNSNDDFRHKEFSDQINRSQTKSHENFTGAGVLTPFDGSFGERRASTSNPNFAGFSNASTSLATKTGGVTGGCLGEIDSGFGSLVQRPSTEFWVNGAFGGFSTVSGKAISVSSALITKKMNIFDNVRVGDDELKAMGNWMGDNVKSEPNNFSSTNPSSLFPGYTTARGNSIFVPSDLVSKSAGIFDNVKIADDDVNSVGDRMMDDERSPRNHNLVPSLAGFSTANGKQIHVSSELISKKTNLFHNVNVADDELSTMENWIGRNDDTGESKVDPPFAGFTTAGGNRILKPSTSNRVHIFDNLNVSADELQKMGNWFPDIECDSGKNAVKKDPISAKQLNSHALFREVTNIAHNETESVSKRPEISTFVRPSPMRRRSMMNSLRKLKESKENALDSIDDNQTPSTLAAAATSTPLSSTPNVCVTPTNSVSTYSQIGRESAEVIRLDDEWDFADQNDQLKNQTPGFISGFMAELSVSSTPINKSENYRSRLKQRRLIDTFDDIASEGCREPIEPINVSQEVKALRRRVFAEQQRSIKKKSTVRAVPSSLFVKKLTSTKSTWKEFVEFERPANKLAFDVKIADNVLNVTATNATQFKFNAWDHYSNEFCRENFKGIYLPDDIVVVMDENCQIGLVELSTAFLLCPSVDPKLVHHKWIENHMKFIVTKLAAMERSFPHRFAGRTLTPENFMLQLKYRYEREIDRAERSAIRKICEMDDIAAKRMVLYVSAITTSVGDCVLELSDGWYSLNAKIDHRMAQFVDQGKIKVGTKLLMQGANVTNLTNGRHPLDVSSDTKLQIYGNSTRRARWDSKLGYCRNAGPFRISLPSVYGSGGNISKLRICVLRVYPVVYINKSKLSDVHSERVERRRTQNEDRAKWTMVDRVYREVSKTFEEEERAARSENRPRKMVKLGEISSITDPEYLCQLLDEDNDPEGIQSELTSTQKTMISNYKDKMRNIRDEEIRTRATAQLASIDKDVCKYVPLLRFKVTDQASFHTTAMVTIWKPEEEILSAIKEGLVFDLTGSSSRGTCSNELQIYAGKNAIFQKVAVNSQVPESLRRRHFCIAEIVAMDQVALNELDTAGFVVHVGETANNFQPVYIADSEQNIVCINFYNSVKSFAYESIVQPKRFLAARNLQWRKSSSSKPIRCAYVTEYSIFTENPQSPELSTAVGMMKSSLAHVDLDEFIGVCREKIRSYNSSIQSTPIRSISASSSSSSMLQSSASSLLKTPTDLSPRPTHSSLTNQSRIEKLSQYGEAMATPPFVINGLKKNFKSPVCKTESNR